jgi:hypothetical protein
MKPRPAPLLALFYLFAGFYLPAAAQSWDFVKEKDGIRIYTRKEPGKTIKSYKGVADIHAPAGRVFALIENVNNTEWWDKNFNQIRVLQYKKFTMAQYYLVYDLPWPVTDRDLCVDVATTWNPVTGEGTITATPLPGIIPEHGEMVRIKAYRQTWTVKPKGSDWSHVVLEGYLDPAGTIPDWVTNMIINDSPVKVITELKKRLEK